MSRPGTGAAARGVLAGAAPGPFALLHRPGAVGGGGVEVLRGAVSHVDAFDGVPQAGAGREALVVVPYRMAAEQGLACHDDGAPLVVMEVAERVDVPVVRALEWLPEVPVRVLDGGFDVSDAEYEELVRRVVEDKIGTGEGCNFVISRSFTGRVEDWSVPAALAVFRRLVEREQGAYWTFLVHTGERTFVGATPERHVTLHDGVATMNPISGTHRYPASGPSVPALVEFLGDAKETDELYMVLDEELKMMGAVCERGARVSGPFLKEMAHLAHTEYLLTGRSTLTPVEILRRTMFAPTVVGSPLVNAFRVVHDVERRGRRYYAGVVALLGRDADGGHTLDSAIMIRTAEVSAAGRVRIPVGATLVRHSRPDAEVAETGAKASGLLAALGHGPGRTVTEPGARPSMAALPQVREALARRNATLNRFWLDDDDGGPRVARADLAGRRVLVVDAEDAFTSMLGHQLTALGLTVRIRSHREAFSTEGFDAVVVGPGPGDPLATDDPRIVRLRALTAGLLAGDVPFLSVCLGHQVLSSLLGLRVVRRPRPNQGVQQRIDLFGSQERVGLYNTFVAVSDGEQFPWTGSAKVEVSRDQVTGEVHALRGPFFASAQFHPESVLTQDGPRILGDLLAPLLAEGVAR